jgi:signal transduction histidine kinase
MYYLRNYISNFLEDSGFKAVIDFSEPEEERKMHPELIRNLFLIVKETLNNAVKYSEGDVIVVSFQMNEDGYVLTVSDNGKGFDTEKARDKGNGMANLLKRTTLIGAELFISGNSNPGSTITVKGTLY